MDGQESTIEDIHQFLAENRRDNLIRVELHKSCKRRSALLAAITNCDMSYIEQSLDDYVGASLDRATREQLSQRLSLLEQWISNAKERFLPRPWT